MTFKPMLAADCKGDVSKLRFPLLASPKLDGIRCIIMNGTALSRSLKPIPNRFIQKWAATNCDALQGLDGELIVGPATGQGVMQRAMSGCMSADGEPDFRFYVFDWVPELSKSDPFDFDCRYTELKYEWCPDDIPCTTLVPHVELASQEELLDYEAHLLELGYEGVMTRAPDGMYKQGRSTMKEQGLVKVKRFATYEAEVIGVEELMHNDNEAVVNALGRTERSTSRGGMRPAGVLGALVCRRPDGVVFNIGTGFTAEQRAVLWGDHHKGARFGGNLIGRAVTYRCFDYGSKDAPRFPVFVSFRDPRDIS